MEIEGEKDMSITPTTRVGLVIPDIGSTIG